MLFGINYNDKSLKRLMEINKGLDEIFDIRNMFNFKDFILNGYYNDVIEIKRLIDKNYNINRTNYTKDDFKDINNMYFKYYKLSNSISKRITNIISNLLDRDKEMCIKELENYTGYSISNNSLESEMKLYDLSDEEKTLIRNGMYESWNFEELGPYDEDDYHKDDV